MVFEMLQKNKKKPTAWLVLDFMVYFILKNTRCWNRNFVFFVCFNNNTFAYLKCRIHFANYVWFLLNLLNVFVFFFIILSCRCWRVVNKTNGKISWSSESGGWNFFYWQRWCVKGSGISAAACASAGWVKNYNIQKTDLILHAKLRYHMYVRAYWQRA